MKPARSKNNELGPECKSLMWTISAVHVINHKRDDYTEDNELCLPVNLFMYSPEFLALEYSSVETSQNSHSLSLYTQTSIQNHIKIANKWWWSYKKQITERAGSERDVVDHNKEKKDVEVKK